MKKYIVIKNENKILTLELFTGKQTKALLLEKKINNSGTAKAIVITKGDKIPLKKLK